MTVQAGFARVATLLADPAREAMLVALADGRALPAGELADAAGISPQSASGHLRKLVDGGVVAVWPQGRFRYFRLADEEVGVALEALAGVATRSSTSRPRPTHLMEARSCFNHLAGRVGVALVEGLHRRGLIAIAAKDVSMTDDGAGWLRAIGIDPAVKRSDRRQLRLCLDWTERRFHLAGAVAGAILRHLLDEGHFRRGAERSLIVTPRGKDWFAAQGIVW
jgi:DNA-binding transcriptional ArsR family regulator